jgi:acrylyl-CoA reductase (NADPH)
MSFRAILVEQQKDDGRITQHSAGVRDLDDGFLTDGDVTVDVEFSGVNFKDGLAVGGKPGVLQNSPMIAGIDLVGIVTASDDSRWSTGDRVVLNGDGIGESRNGGLAERARIRGDALVRVPDAISSRRAAAIGTAGFTAMLAVLALEREGVEPDPSGDSPILVTGAAGGVGSVAIALLAHRGYPVTASTGRAAEQGDYLTRLGARAVIDRAEFSEAGKPMQRQRWSGAIDSVGSATLANVLAQVRYGGAVAACGLAQGPDLPGSVLPFILRSVTLTGINSVDAPRALREQAWSALATELDLDLLDAMTTTIPLDAVPQAADDILAGRIRGRTVVDVRA